MITVKNMASPSMAIPEGYLAKASQYRLQLRTMVYAVTTACHDSVKNFHYRTIGDTAK